MKKAWEKPKLVILVRGKPAERILGYCKTDGGNLSSSTYFTGCDQPFGMGADAAACDLCWDLDPS